MKYLLLLLFIVQVHSDCYIKNKTLVSDCSKDEYCIIRRNNCEIDCSGVCIPGNGTPLSSIEETWRGLVIAAGVSAVLAVISQCICGDKGGGCSGDKGGGCSGVFIAISEILVILSIFFFVTYEENPTYYYWYTLCFLWPIPLVLLAACWQCCIG